MSEASVELDNQRASTHEIVTAWMSTGVMYVVCSCGMTMESNDGVALRGQIREHLEDEGDYEL